MMTQDLFLRKGADRRLRGGHLWVYSNEVDTKRSRLSDFQPGDAVCVRSADGSLLGSAYMEPQALICARIYAPKAEQALNTAFFAQRLEAALESRESAFARPFYRLVYGDSDLLPGVVIDRFGPYLGVLKAALQRRDYGTVRWQRQTTKSTSLNLGLKLKNTVNRKCCILFG